MLLSPKQVSGADAANIPELRGGSQCYCVAGGCSTAARKLNRDGSLSTVSDRDWGGRAGACKVCKLHQEERKPAA